MIINNIENIPEVTALLVLILVLVKVDLNFRSARI